MRHLVLLHPQDQPDHSMNPTHTQLPALINNFCFLESLELGDIWNIQGDSILLIPPNVKALKLCSHPGTGLASRTSVNTLLSRTESDLTVTVLEIAVLKLLEYNLVPPEPEMHKIISNLCQAIRELLRLQNLFMSRLQVLHKVCFRALLDMGDDFKLCIQEQAKSLKTVIGVELPCRPLLAPNLIFITYGWGKGGDLLFQLYCQKTR